MPVDSNKPIFGVPYPASSSDPGPKGNIGFVSALTVGKSEFRRLNNFFYQLDFSQI